MRGTRQSAAETTAARRRLDDWRSPAVPSQISAAVASPFIAGALASAFLSPEQKANYKTSGMPDVNVFIGAENVADKVVPVLARDARVSPRGGR